jgi:hypothetical protein
MNQTLQFLDNIYQLNAVPSLEAIMQGLLLAFILGQAIAWVYVWTHSGLSYSRSFTQMLVMIPIVIALVMIIIGNNIITAFGLLGALALIRFRNVLKDTRDTVFIFITLVVGMATGSQRYATAILGTVFMLGVLYYVYWTDFGSRGRYDGYLRFSLPSDPESEARMKPVLQHFCRNVHQIAMRQVAGQLADCTYQVRLRDRHAGSLMLAEVEKIEGVRNASLILQEEMAEV